MFLYIYHTLDAPITNDMLQWKVEPIVLELKYTWKISRNASDSKTNLIVSVTDGNFSGRGEAAPNIRYNESADEGMRLFPAFASIAEKINQSASAIDQVIQSASLFNSLSFAVESAWIRYLSALNNRSIYDTLEIDKPGSIHTSYTIPIMETGLMKKFYEENRLHRFPFIKLKVNCDDAGESLPHLLSFCNQLVMVDANESFTDVEQCIYWMEKNKRRNIEFVEQPMPASMKEESAYLKKHSPFPLFADESVTDHADFDELKKSFHGVNIKLMKAGGIRNGIRLLKEARKYNMKTMIGCMVETTLGISTAMHLCSLADYADLDSFILVKNEPFGLVHEANGELTFVP